MKNKNKNKTIVLQKEYKIVNDAIKKIFNQPTPQEFVKRRRGRGGKEFSYVEIGYVVKKLNEIFGPFWKFEIIEKGKEEDQIWVLGRLTVYFSKELFVSKEQYGSSFVKRDKQTNKPLLIGDDYKAATSDALKKCASLFGIAADVYFQNDEELPEDEIIDQTSCSKNEVKKCPECGTSGQYHRKNCRYSDINFLLINQGKTTFEEELKKLKVSSK